MKKKLIMLFTSLIALVLEILPYGADRLTSRRSARTLNYSSDGDVLCKKRIQVCLLASLMIFAYNDSKIASEKTKKKAVA